MHNDPTILDTIEPEVVEQLVSRRAAIKKGATIGGVTAAGLAMASMPVALAALAREARAQTPSVTEVLNFALMLEIFENEFYKAVLGTSASATQNSAFATVRAAVPAAAVTSLTQIQKHEKDHVEFLLANGATNVLSLNADSFDFTGNRGNATPGPFVRATTELAFLLLVAQGAEDTGVRAYQGQAGNLMSNKPVLEAALRIHSVEARHAAKIRRLRRATGAPEAVRFSGTVRGGGAAAAGAGNITSPPAGAVAALELIYAGEQTTTIAGVNVAGLSGIEGGTDAVTEAFDQPLTKTQVITIVQPFFKPTIPA